MLFAHCVVVAKFRLIGLVCFTLIYEVQLGRKLIVEVVL